jgi:hypothetical protein
MAEFTQEHDFFYGLAGSVEIISLRNYLIQTNTTVFKTLWNKR